MTEKTVTISKKEYAELLQTRDEMIALEASGVDNWEWYSESFDIKCFTDKEGNEVSYRELYLDDD